MPQHGLPSTSLPPSQVGTTIPHPNRGILQLPGPLVTTAVPGLSQQPQVSTSVNLSAGNRPVPASGQAPTATPSSPILLNASAGPAGKGPVGING
jgi:hypothetical protein